MVEKAAAKSTMEESVDEVTTSGGRLSATDEGWNEKLPSDEPTPSSCSRACPRKRTHPGGGGLRSRGHRILAATAAVLAVIASFSLRLQGCPKWLVMFTYIAPLKKIQ